MYLILSIIFSTLLGVVLYFIGDFGIIIGFGVIVGIFIRILFLLIELNKKSTKLENTNNDKNIN